MAKDMKTEILDLQKEFEYIPEVVNGDKLKEFSCIAIGGMGGSGLVAGILRALDPKLDIATHHEYGLPQFISEKEGRLYLAISHSGNTAETVSFLEEAIAEELPAAVITKGGKLLALAEKNGLPHIVIPDDGIEPRMSLGFMLRAVAKLIGEEKLFDELETLSKSLDPVSLEEEGKELAEKVGEGWPIIYSSRRNQSIAYNWKIKINETGKFPAFYNSFPELNHNEMQGFVDESAKYARIILIRDDEDDKRIIERMDAMEELFEKQDISVTSINIKGKSRAARIFTTLTLGDWVAYHIALQTGKKPEGQPMIDEFKEKLS